jgi:putative selenium metabolism hydrolase
MFKLSSADRDALTAFAQRLVRTPSPSTHEKRVSEQLREELGRVGFDSVNVDRIGNVVARAGNGDGPTLLFNAHMDTVGISDPSTWTHDPYGGEIVDGMLYGRGAVDMKGPLASLVYGMKLLLDAGVELNGALYVVGIVQEEPCEGYAIKTFMETEDLTPDMVVLCEPSNLQVATGHRGRMEIQVVVSGTSAHASTPGQGENAIYAASRLIFGIELLSTQLATDSSLGRGTLAVTQIESMASSRNAIPDRCVLYIDRRLTLGETETRVLSEIQSIINREQVRATAHVSEYRATSYTGHECHAKEYYPAWLMADDHKLVRALEHAVEDALGYRPRHVRWPFSTDGSYTMGVAGIPTVGFGPGDPILSHTADEHIRVDDLYQAAMVYAALAETLLK